MFLCIFMSLIPILVMLYCTLSVCDDSFASVSSKTYLFCFSVLTDIFPGGLALAATKMSPFWILLELRMTTPGSYAIGEGASESDGRS